jgi:hypothetical protein
MNYKELNERYYAFSKNTLPFGAEDFEQINNDYDFANKEDLIRQYEMRYESHLAAHDDKSDPDFDYFLSSLRNFEGTQVTCLFLLSKKHYLTFVLDPKMDHIIAVFPILKWSKLVENDYNQSRDNVL